MPAKKLRDFLEKQRKEGVKEQFLLKAGEKSSLIPIPQTLDAEVALYCIKEAYENSEGSETYPL